MTHAMVDRLAVCIVEDEGRLRELLVREIGAMGHKSAGYSSAEEAWPVLSGGGFDVAMLDLNLPGMSGMELFEQIRKADLPLRVVILTGFGSLESAVQALRWDADDYLTKPCSLREIEAVLARLLIEKRTGIRACGTLGGGGPAADEAGVGETGDAGAATAGPTHWPAAAGSADSLRTLEDLEREHILAALQRHAGNKPAAARELGISLRTLYNKLNMYRTQGFVT